MVKMKLAGHDDVVKTFPPDRTGGASRRNTNCRDPPSSNHGKHGSIVGAPVAPHIAALVPAESAMEAAGAVIVTAIAVTGSSTEAAAKVIATKSVTSATATITAVAGKCAGGEPGTSENKENSKNRYGVA
jgi:hypothetical protein